MCTVPPKKDYAYIYFYLFVFLFVRTDSLPGRNASSREKKTVAFRPFISLRLLYIFIYFTPLNTSLWLLCSFVFLLLSTCKAACLLEQFLLTFLYLRRVTPWQNGDILTGFSLPIYQKSETPLLYLLPPLLTCYCMLSQKLLVSVLEWGGAI